MYILTIDKLACSSRLRGLEEEERRHSGEGEQLLGSGENLRESPRQSSSRPACPRTGGLDIQVWWKSVVRGRRHNKSWLFGHCCHSYTTLAVEIILSWVLTPGGKMIILYVSWNKPHQGHAWHVPHSLQRAFFIMFIHARSTVHVHWISILWSWKLPWPKTDTVCKTIPLFSWRIQWANSVSGWIFYIGFKALLFFLTSF